MPRKKTYDVACYDLATSFLSDEQAINNPQNRAELASEIQEVIEDFIKAKRLEQEEYDSQRLDDKAVRKLAERKPGDA